MSAWMRPHLPRLGYYEVAGPKGRPVLFWVDIGWILHINQLYTTVDFGEMTVTSLDWSSEREGYIEMPQPFKPSGCWHADGLGTARYDYE